MSAPGSMAVTLPLSLPGTQACCSKNMEVRPPGARSTTARIGADVHQSVHETPQDRTRNMRQPALPDPATGRLPRLAPLPETRRSAGHLRRAVHNPATTEGHGRVPEMSPNGHQ